MGPRLDTGGWLTLTETHYWISTGRDFHPARCTELSSARWGGARGGTPHRYEFYPPSRTRKKTPSGLENKNGQKISSDPATRDGG